MLDPVPLAVDLGAQPLPRSRFQRVEHERAYSDLSERFDTSSIGGMESMFIGTVERSSEQSSPPSLAGFVAGRRRLEVIDPKPRGRRGELTIFAKLSRTPCAGSGRLTSATSCSSLDEAVSAFSITSCACSGVIVPMATSDRSSATGKENAMECHATPWANSALRISVSPICGPVF